MLRRLCSCFWTHTGLNGLAMLALGLLPGGLMTLCYQAVAASLH